ncbi:product YwdK [Luminiphilus syltensis NOR5-1B]|uniref:Product YwdK n=1 Tax=Luminiphilus syltensis NOR5-1B TaxID=565045 RepID=B8KU85_9GAMM|nr:DUF423 domain-containing protein [Luminiphilus syltensis]EED34137.1 product YwdK [Luminiphilus syltensis NOR5-1B]
MTEARRRWPLLLAAFFGATGVIAGAFGAHALQQTVAPEYLQVWETAARYQLLHALGLFALALFSWVVPLPGALRWTQWLWCGGILIFSGSLYALVLTGERWLGAITPFGGAALILGWAAIAVAAIRQRAPAS